jgi:hypothetical protein
MGFNLAFKGLIIKFNIKSLEDGRLLKNLERDDCSLAYVFLVCYHQHLRTRWTSINVLFDWKCNYGRTYCCVHSFRRWKEWRSCRVSNK